MTKHHVLVTGGAGFIGSHTCKELRANGFVPIAYDNLTTGHRDAVMWGPLVEGDVLEQERLERVVKQYRPVAVIHFAACAYVEESMRNPGKYYRNNVAGTLSLVEACARSGIRRIIFSSSCAIYGIPAQIPVSEECETNPLSPYGRSKLMSEQIIRDFAEVHDLAYLLLRYFNACGADPDGQLCERHEPETHLIPRALMAAAGTIKRLSIFGNDYPTPDGTCIRDYIHVTDLARAHTRALTYLLDGGESSEFNLGTGKGHSVMQIVEAIERVTGRAVPLDFKPGRPGDPPALLADASQARSCLGFEPVCSDLETIISTAASAHGWKASRKHVERGAYA